MPEEQQPSASPASRRLRVLVELRVPSGYDTTHINEVTAEWAPLGFEAAAGSEPISIPPPAVLSGTFGPADEKVYLIPGSIPTDQLTALARHPRVVKITRDEPVEPITPFTV